MPTPSHASTEWRVTAEHIRGVWFGWTIRVYVRTTWDDREPGPWRMIRESTYTVPNGQVKGNYWKDLIREAAKG